MSMISNRASRTACWHLFYISKALKQSTRTSNYWTCCTQRDFALLAPFVVDTGNYYPRQRDGRIVEIESGMPESRWVEQKLGRPVIKAFNNIYARHLLERGRPRGSPGRIALPVAGDDAKAKAVVLQLVDELGFDAVDAGGLDDCWRQQRGTPVYTTDLDAEGVLKALSAARRQRTPDWTATPKSPGNFANPA